MIDLFSIGANVLWIVGLATALAAVSYAIWDAWASHTSLRERLGRTSYQIVLDLSAILFCLGLAGTSPALWQALLWLLLAATFFWQIWSQAIKRQ